MDIGPSTSKGFSTNDFNKLPTHKTPTLTDDKSHFGLKRSGTVSGAKRPRISVDDYNSSFSENTKADVNSNSQRKTNGGILRRVTNTVSGLFSNSSWSEWLKGSSPLTVPNDTQDSFHNSSRSIGSDASNSFETKKGKRLNQLYPEEGIEEAADMNEVAGISTSQPVSIENSWAPLKNIISPFKEEQSFIASTPALSPYLPKRGNDDLLGDPVLLKQSSSNFYNELLPPRDDSVTALKHSFSEAHTENYGSQTNGSISTFPSSRKRLRETMEGETKNAEVNARSLTQIFTEDTEESIETLTRKRPRFSISTYGSPFYSKATEDEPSFSIFYPGKIMYGGASNHQRKRNRIIPRKIRPRTPAIVSGNEDDHSDGGLSSAARRILDCIDKISTPLSDSKRAFQFCGPRDFSFNSSSFVADFHKNRPTMKNTVSKDSPPVTKLLTPSKVKITKNFSSLFASKSDETETSMNEENFGKKRKECSPDNNKTDSSSSSFQKSSGSYIPKESTSNQELFKNSTMNSKQVSKSSSIFDSRIANSSTSKLDAQKSNQVNEQNHDSVTFTKVKENPNLTAKIFAFDNVDYKFSNPAVVSDLSLLENLPKSSIEFKFSQPINEAELSSSKQCPILDNKQSGFIVKKNKWNCNTCLLQNDVSELKCAACEAPKPEKVMVSKSSFATSKNFSCAFKKPVGSWECESCLLQNKSDQENCVACLAAKPKKEPKSQEVSSDKKQSNLSYSGCWGEAFKRPEGLWDCPKCLLQNKSTVNICASCEAPKLIKNNSGSSNSAKNSINNWGDAFKPSEGSWVCESCLVHNTSNCSNCLCCKSAKPTSDNESKTKSSAEISHFSLETSISKSVPKHQGDLKENGWICPECFLTNNNLEVKCSSCKCMRPVPANDSPKISKAPITGSFPSHLLKGKDEWECETCCVRNKNSNQKCQSCDTPKASLSHSDIVSEALTGNFKFDANLKPKVNDSLSTYKFGATTDPKEKSSGFNFGVNPLLSKNEKPNGSNVELGKTSEFSFGISTAMPKVEKPSNSNLDVNSSKDVKSGFKFGVNTSKDVGVSFGVSSSNDVKSDTVTFEADVASSKIEKSSSLNLEVNQGSTKGLTTSAFSFGVPASKTSDFSFGIGSPLSKDSSGNIEFNNPSKALNDENLNPSKILASQSSNKEPSKSITFDITEVKSSGENTVKPENSSTFKAPVESKTSSISITNSSSSKLIFGATPSTVSLLPPNNASDSVSTKTTAATTFSFFTPSVQSKATKPTETITSNQDTKRDTIFQFGSSNLSTQNSGTKFEFPKLDNSSGKEPNDFFSQLPKINPSNFNFFGNTGSTQSVDNKPSIPYFGNSKPPPPPYGDHSKSLSFGDPKVGSSLFVFGNNDVKSQNTGFSFGKSEKSNVAPSAPTFGGFGSSLSQPFKFGQQETKLPETAAPSPFNYNAELAQNPFNAAQSAAPQKTRITRKAHRRLR